MRIDVPSLGLLLIRREPLTPPDRPPVYWLTARRGEGTVELVIHIEGWAEPGKTACGLDATRRGWVQHESIAGLDEPARQLRLTLRRCGLCSRPGSKPSLAD